MKIENVYNQVQYNPNLAQHQDAEANLVTDFNKLDLEKNLDAEEEEHIDSSNSRRQELLKNRELLVKDRIKLLSSVRDFVKDLRPDEVVKSEFRRQVAYTLGGCLQASKLSEDKLVHTDTKTKEAFLICVTGQDKEELQKLHEFFKDRFEKFNF